MRMSNLKNVAIVAAVLGTLAVVPAHAGKTLDGIKARGQVVCGVNTGLAGFSAADSNGKWTGLDVDICRAIAVKNPGALRPSNPGQCAWRGGRSGWLTISGTPV